jgi:hypothetical protein
MRIRTAQKRMTNKALPDTLAGQNKEGTAVSVLTCRHPGAWVNKSSAVFFGRRIFMRVRLCTRFLSV